LFKSAELGDFELLRAFPAANAGLPLPAPIRDLLKWSLDQAAFPGAYAPR